MTRASRIVRRPLTVLAVCLALADGCGKSGGHPSPAPSASPVALPSSPTALPTFTWAQFQRLLVTLRGKPVVVNVWASWCGPCIKEAPILAKAATTYEGRVQFVGVDIEDNYPPARAFIQKYGWSYPSVFDPNGEIRNGLLLHGQPATIGFDSSGNRGFLWEGPIPESRLLSNLASLH